MITNSRLRWATFTAADGTQDSYSTVWTQSSTGLDLLPLWNCSEKWELTPHAMGGMEPSSRDNTQTRKLMHPAGLEPLEVGLSLQSKGEPPHLFLCREFMPVWGQSPYHTPAVSASGPVSLCVEFGE